LGKVLSSGIKS
jgi:hypothetical protein